MTTAAKPRKATTPRKAARAKTSTNGGSANGHAPVEETRPPEEYTVAAEPEPQPEPQPEPEPEQPKLVHPYGDTDVFVYQPSGPFPPIIFPAVTTLAPTPKFFWKIYPLNEMYQAFEWMIFARVPRSIQEQVMDMGERDPREQAEFFRRWFLPISRPQGGPTPPGES